MADLTTDTKNKVFDHLLRGVTWTKPAAQYLTIFTTAPTDAGGGTEVSDISSRQPVTFGAPTDGLGDNSGEVLWDAAVAGYTAVAIGIHDASSGGILLAWKAISEVVAVGVKFRYPIGDFDVDVQ